MLRQVVVNLSISGNLVAKNAGLVPVSCRKSNSIGWVLAGVVIGMVYKPVMR